jgi:hypothetical protein
MNTTAGFLAIGYKIIIVSIFFYLGFLFYDSENEFYYQNILVWFLVYFPLVYAYEKIAMKIIELAFKDNSKKTNTKEKKTKEKKSFNELLDEKMKERNV